MDKTIDLRSRWTLRYQGPTHFLHVAILPSLCQITMDKVLSGRSVVSGLISPCSHLSSLRFIDDTHRLFKRTSRGGKKRHGHRIWRQTCTRHVRLSAHQHTSFCNRQIPHNAGIVLVHHSVHTVLSGRYRAPRSIYTPLERVDERDGRQKKERKTCAGAKGEKISSPNQTAAASSYQGQGWRCVCLSVLVGGCGCVGGASFRKIIDSPVVHKSEQHL